MKNEEDIKKVLYNLPIVSKTKFAAMTYESGIEEALMWVLGELKDDEFEYFSKNLLKEG